MAPAVDEVSQKEYTGIMHVLDATGDTEHRWSRHSPAEIEAARAVFGTMKGKGYAAYKIKADGTRGEVIQSFDPDAEKIVFRPPMVGG